jgi:hypothetical protein
MEIMNAVQDNPGLVAANLIVLLCAGVAFCFWTIYYTDWFPVIGGLLGLSGAFAWVGFMANVIADERKEAFQRWLDERVLQAHWPWLIVGLGLFAFASGVMARSGALIVDSRGDEVSRTITVRPAAGGVETTQFKSAPPAEQSTLLWTGFLEPRDYAVSAAGFPTVVVTARPLRRERFSLPGDAIAAPVVLVRPDPTLSGITSNGEYDLLVDVNGTAAARLTDYRGTSVWIGTGRDVTVPRHAIDRWRSEQIAEEAYDAVMRRWTTPNAVPSVTMAHGNVLRVALVSPQTNVVLAEACRNVTPPDSYFEYPLELEIHEHGRCP